MNWHTRALIGASAGACLAIIKLVETNFYIGLGRQALIGGLLTAVAFVALATIFTTFADEPSAGKLFMRGLLAPSFLIAIVHRGVELPPPGDGAGLEGVLDISVVETRPSGWAWLSPIQVAYAAAPQPSTAIRVVERSDVTAGVGDGALLMVGRGRVPDVHTFVVGRTADETRARAFAQELQSLLGDAQQVQLLRPEGATHVFISVGGLQSASAALASRQAALLAILGAGRAGGAGVPQTILSAVSSGRVIPGKALFGASPS